MNISESITINKPVGEVYAAFVDIEKIGERIPGIVKIEVTSDVKSGVGTHWKETRVMFGKESTEEMEITKVDEVKSITIESDSAGTHYVTEYTFVEKSEGTEVTMSFSGVAKSLMAKIMSPMMGLMAGSMKKMLRADLESMKESLEK
jgi:carbon monoxide dehydrogenase subunit G